MGRKVSRAERFEVSGSIQECMCGLRCINKTNLSGDLSFDLDFAPLADRSGAAFLVADFDFFGALGMMMSGGLMVVLGGASLMESCGAGFGLELIVGTGRECSDESPLSVSVAPSLGGAFGGGCPGRL